MLIYSQQSLVMAVYYGLFNDWFTANSIAPSSCKAFRNTDNTFDLNQSMAQHPSYYFSQSPPIFPDCRSRWVIFLFEGCPTGFPGQSGLAGALAGIGRPSER